MKKPQTDCFSHISSINQPQMSHLKQPITPVQGLFSREQHKLNFNYDTNKKMGNDNATNDRSTKAKTTQPI